MKIDQWAALIVAIITVLTAIIGAFRWLIRSYLIELKPNSGSSMNDRLTAVEVQVYKIYELLLEDRLGR